MKPRSNLISDLAQMANGAASALGTMREDVQMMRRGRAERSQAAAGMVTQEDFEALMSRVDALSAQNRASGITAKTARKGQTRNDKEKTGLTM